MKRKKRRGQKNPSKVVVEKKYQKYGYGLKRRVVHEVESGKRTMEDAREYYQIKGKSLIYAWIKKYGHLTYDPKIVHPMKKSPREEIKELKAKIEFLELEKDILLDITEAYEEEGVDVKKYLPEQLRKEYVNRKKGAQ